MSVTQAVLGALRDGVSVPDIARQLSLPLDFVHLISRECAASVPSEVTCSPVSCRGCFFSRECEKKPAVAG